MVGQFLIATQLNLMARQGECFLAHHEAMMMLHEHCLAGDRKSGRSIEY